MDFEKLYQKYQEGTCTEEERIFIEGEIEKARKITLTMENLEPPTYKQAEEERANKAKKKFNLKLFIKATLISLIVFVLLGGATVGIIFGVAAGNAKNNTHTSKVEAKAIAVDCVYDYAVQNGYTGNKDAVRILETDRDLRLQSPLRKSYYSYEFEVSVNYKTIEVEVNTRTGECRIIDVDND